MALTRPKRPLLSELLINFFKTDPDALQRFQLDTLQARGDQGKLARIFDKLPFSMAETTLQERLQALRMMCDSLQVNGDNRLMHGSDKGAVEALISQWLHEIIEDTLGQDGQLEKQLATVLNWQAPLTQHEVYLFLISGLNVIWQNLLDAWTKAEEHETYGIPGAKEEAHDKKIRTLNAVFLFANTQQVCAWAVNALRQTGCVVNEQALNKIHPTDWQQDLLRRVKKPEVVTTVGIFAGLVGVALAGFMLFSGGMAPVDIRPPAPENPKRSTPH